MREDLIGHNRNTPAASMAQIPVTHQLNRGRWSGGALSIPDSTFGLEEPNTPQGHVIGLWTLLRTDLGSSVIEQVL